MIETAEHQEVPELHRQGFAHRLRAAGWHMAISALLGVLCAWLIFRHWYPWPFASLAGGMGLIVLLLTVDIVLGPVLTMVVASPGKKSRVFARDLFVIATIQLLALCYGLMTVIQARPVYLVHEVDRFNLVTAADVDSADLAQASPAFRTLPWSGVTVIGLRPVDGADAVRSVQMALAGKDLSLRPELWEPLNERHLQQMRQRAIPLDKIRAARPAEWAALVSLHGSATDFVALPVVGRWATWTVVLDGKTGHILGYLPLDPF